MSYYNGKKYTSKIAQLRQKKGLTQRQVAQLLNVDNSTIQSWERGRDGMKMFVRISDLCKLLNCSPSDLFEEQNDNHTEVS